MAILSIPITCMRTNYKHTKKSLRFQRSRTWLLCCWWTACVDVLMQLTRDADQKTMTPTSRRLFLRLKGMGLIRRRVLIREEGGWGWGEESFTRCWNYILANSSYRYHLTHVGRDICNWLKAEETILLCRHRCSEMKESISFWYPSYLSKVRR